MLRLAFQAVAVFAIAGASGYALRGQAQTPSRGARRNVIVFVADGLRHGSVTPQDMPTLASLRASGVDFQNSYSMFPTFTMANASAIATGHRLGDTGIFSNTLWVGYPTFDTGNFNNGPGSAVPFIENDQILSDLDEHFHGNVLGEQSLLSVARAHGYNTAAIGKVGPATLQDVQAVAPEAGDFPSAPASILIDDSTAFGAMPLAPEVRRLMMRENLPTEAPARSNGYGASSQYNNGYGGDRTHPGTIMANVVQQQWFADVATRVVLPMFETDGRPFALVYWSRDPDGTQHNQGDSLNELFPGINGPSSHQALRNADNNLKQLLGWLDAHPAIKANTDVFVTSDHGFATVSRREIDRTGKTSSAESAQHTYLDASGGVDTEQGTLPPGFLAIDLAFDFKFNLFDPDRRVVGAGRNAFRAIRINTSDAWEHPILGSGFLGTMVEKLDGSDARIIVAANGGSDLVYVPNGNPDMVEAVAERALGYDYVSAVFIDDVFQKIPGTLPTSLIGFQGKTAMPKPALVVVFKTFYLNGDDIQTAAQISDSSMQEGQGQHGGFGRECTFNAMAAWGPDFKTHFSDTAPVSNADITPTLAQILGFDLPSVGALKGRVIKEALLGGPSAPAAPLKYVSSDLAGGSRAAFYYEELDGERYGAAACRVAADRQDPASMAACRQ